MTINFDEFKDWIGPRLTNNQEEVANQFPRILVAGRFLPTHTQSQTHKVTHFFNTDTHFSLSQSLMASKMNEVCCGEPVLYRIPG